MSLICSWTSRLLRYTRRIIITVKVCPLRTLPYCNSARERNENFSYPIFAAFRLLLSIFFPVSQMEISSSEEAFPERWPNWRQLSRHFENFKNYTLVCNPSYRINFSGRACNKRKKFTSLVTRDHCVNQTVPCCNIPHHH